MAPAATALTGQGSSIRLSAHGNTRARVRHTEGRLGATGTFGGSVLGWFLLVVVLVNYGGRNEPLTPS